jgi:hypothetical protein
MVLSSGFNLQETLGKIEHHRTSRLRRPITPLSRNPPFPVSKNALAAH